MRPVLLSTSLSVTALSVTALLATALLATAPAAAGARAASAFDHSRLDGLLRRHVDSDGRVDYEALVAARADLDGYVDSLAACSPGNSPQRFASRADSLAYWINAYNACVLRGVVDVWPIASVADVPGGLDGFFRSQRFVVGGDSLSLDDIENGIIRPVFQDPRIHFAVNCAAASCPALDARAYAGADLDDHLDRQTRRFAANSTHVRVDGERVRLSRLLDWYGQDFVQWFPRDEGSSAASPSLVDYVRLYAPTALAAQLPPAGSAQVEFLDYDWALNGPSAPRAASGTRD